jgi:Flp pilus assembly protein TadG
MADRSPGSLWSHRRPLLFGHVGRRDQRGIALIEFAFVSLIMLTIVAGAVDYGRGWQSGLATIEAARTGARVGSGQANRANADYNALTGIRASLMASGKMNDVELVVIYRADNVNGVPPASCTPANPVSSASGTCNVFTGTQLQNMTAANFNITWAADPADPPTGGSGCATSNRVHAGWCPTSRTNVQASADYMGVYIRYRQRNLFKILGNDRVLSRTAVMRLEPPSL